MATEQGASPEAQLAPAATKRSGPQFVSVKISAGSAVAIVELSKDDGRERHENGRTPLEAGVEAHFILSEQQSIRIVAAE